MVLYLVYLTKYLNSNSLRSLGSSLKSHLISPVSALRIAPDKFLTLTYISSSLDTGSLSRIFILIALFLLFLSVCFHSCVSSFLLVSVFFVV